LLAFENMACAHDHAIGRRAAHREFVLVDLAQTQRVVERKRMSHAGLVMLRRHDPDIFGKRVSDLLAGIKPRRVNAVVVGDQNAQWNLSGRRVFATRYSLFAMFFIPPI
jgi:hypothetical protein